MSQILAAAKFESLNNCQPLSPEFKPTQSPVNYIMELSLPESQISNDSFTNIEASQNKDEETSQPKRKLTIYEYLECKRSDSF